MKDFYSERKKNTYFSDIYFIIFSMQ
jgi:hypothetical protein